MLGHVQQQTHDVLVKTYLYVINLKFSRQQYSIKSSQVRIAIGLSYSYRGNAGYGLCSQITPCTKKYVYKQQYYIACFVFLHFGTI
jgi:hypothetical protein